MKNYKAEKIQTPPINSSLHATKRELISLDKLLCCVGTESLSKKINNKKAPRQWINTWLKEDPGRLDFVDCFYECSHNLRPKAKTVNILLVKIKMHESASSADQHLTLK